MDSVADKLKQKLLELHPTHLIVRDDSGNHIGHVGNPDGAGQTHFSVQITASAFSGKTRVERQRMVLALVEPLWQETTLHALSIKAYTPDESPVA